MFSEFFKEINLRDAFLADDPDTAGQLSGLFSRHTLHEIHLCESYVEWKDVDAQQGGDFDIVLIDINLGTYTTPAEERPDGIDNPKFDEKAGFYIYHQLIRRGFPDGDIAFFTAEGKSVKEFSRYCGDIFLEKPANCFQKDSTHFEQLRLWLSEKAVQQSLILRRGVINGCRFIKQEIEAMDTSELGSRLIFYKTIPGKLKDDSEALRRDSVDYLTRLERLFLPHQSHDEAERRRLFTKELAAPWEESWGGFIRAKEAPHFETWLESRFHNAAQVEMKMLRNWSSHRLLARDLSAREVAYYFMLAMRAFVEMDLSEVFRYEEILSTLFKKISDLELKRLMNSGFEFRLERSYEHLKALHADVLRHVDQSCWEKMPSVRYERRLENYFLAILRETGEAARCLKSDNSKYYLGRIREASLGLFYQSFWHGLSPMEIKTTYYANLEKIKFDIQPIPPSFISFLGRSIFEESFEEVDAAVYVA
jgi:hypothetical protein